MMQFTENHAPPPPPLHGGGLGLCLDLGAAANPLRRARPWPGFPTSTAKSLGSINNATCMEQLLVHCANAIEGNDATLVQQILWVLNNIAPPDGDSNQRLTSSFLRALVARTSRTGNCQLLAAAVAPSDSIHTHRFSAVDLAAFIDITPWYRFGFTAANAAILDAVEGFSVVHVVDLGITHCMQIPTLIDALAGRPEGPPFLRLSVPCAAASRPPVLDISYDELGARLVNFARSRNVGMEFRVVPTCSDDGFASLIDQLRVQQLVSEGEALVVNCQMLLHYIPDELRAGFLKGLRSLDTAVVTVVDEDADFTAKDVVGRLKAAFNYMWIPYDAVDTFLARGSEQRRWYEAGVGWRIENVVAHEGMQRVERVEPKVRWVQRMRAAGFRGVVFGDDTVAEVKGMLDDHAAGWGLKKEEKDDLVLTWKGHNVVFATAWVAATSS